MYSSSLPGPPACLPLSRSLAGGRVLRLVHPDSLKMFSELSKPHLYPQFVTDSVSVPIGTVPTILSLLSLSRSRGKSRPDPSHDSPPIRAPINIVPV